MHYQMHVAICENVEDAASALCHRPVTVTTISDRSTFTTAELDTVADAFRAQIRGLLEFIAVR